MTKDRHLNIGCCTAVLDHSMFARLNRLQVAAQTLVPDFHAIIAASSAFHRSVLNDLIDRTTLYREVPPETSTLAAFSLGLEELFAKRVQLFFCLDHDCLYYRDYVETICRFVRSKRLNLKKGDFCLNLIDQHRINLYNDDSATVEMGSFAPSTFVFGRGAAAAAVIDAAKTETLTSNGFHDITWRRALCDLGIQITQVKTRAPVFGYVRRGQPLAEKRRLLANGPAGGLSSVIELIWAGQTVHIRDVAADQGAGGIAVARRAKIIEPIIVDKDMTVDKANITAARGFGSQVVSH
jgi:hypothetical protein